MHRLSVGLQTIPLYLLPFGRDAIFTGDCKPQFGRRVGHMGSEMGPLSSPGTTSYRLFIDLSLTVFFAVLWMFQTDRRTDGIGVSKAALCTKVLRPPKNE